MNATMPIEKAQANLAEIVANMASGDELVLTKQERTVAVVTKPVEPRLPREPGTATHYKYWMADDFNDSMDENGEYVQ